MKKLLLTLATFAATCFGIQAGNVTFDFTQINGFDNWSNTYTEHQVTYTEGTVTFAKANKQNSDQPITTMPVTKGENVTFVIKDSYAPITSAKLTCKQWKTTAQTISVSTSTDGTTFTKIVDMTSDDFVLDVTSVPEGTIAVQFSFSNNKQVGIKSLEITYAGEGGGTETPENPDPQDPETPDTHDGDYWTAETLGLSNYADFSGKVGKSDAVYAGNAAKNAQYNNSIQLRGSNNSGIVSTTSGGYIRTINVTWNSNTAAARKLDVYGSNEPYTAATNLYSEENAGKLLGSIPNGTTSFTVKGNYKYVGVRSNSGALYLDDIEFVWGEAQVIPATPVITTTEVEAGVEVTITCETAGATIYYTLDGTEPTAESTEYSAPFTVSATTTVKAVAFVGENDSEVASQVVKVYEVIEGLENINNAANNTYFSFTEDLTVVYVKGQYNYVIDAENNYGLIFGNFGLEAGQVIKGGWNGKINIYNGLTELIPEEETLEVDGTAALPAPVTVNADNANQILIAGNQNMYVKIFGLVIPTQEATRAATNTTAKLGNTDVILRSNFVDTPTEAGTYNVTGFISVFNSDVQVFATEFTPVTSVAAPTFSKLAGKYDDTIEITLACETPEAVIYYSVDGTEPTNEYDNGASIAIDQAYVTVKAVAKLGNVESEVATASYTILSLGVDFVAADNDAEYYTVSGVKINNAAVAPGLYIRVNNGKAQKVIIRK